MKVFELTCDKCDTRRLFRVTKEKMIDLVGLHHKNCNGNVDHSEIDAKYIMVTSWKDHWEVSTTSYTRSFIIFDENDIAENIDTIFIKHSRHLAITRRFVDADIENHDGEHVDTFVRALKSKDGTIVGYMFENAGKFKGKEKIIKWLSDKDIQYIDIIPAKFEAIWKGTVKNFKFDEDKNLRDNWNELKFSVTQEKILGDDIKEYDEYIKKYDTNGWYIKKIYVDNAQKSIDEAWGT